MALKYAGGFDPTDCQREAMEYTEGSLIVGAGAGSGKTRVLVERFINLIRLGKAAIDDIVAITFTRKAAEEMKARVRETFRQLGEESAHPERWRRLAGDVDNAYISTIHSFCSRLLRQFPAEVGIDPAFSVLEEDHARLLLSRAVEEQVLSFLKEHSDSPVWEHFGFGELCRALQEVYLKMRSKGVDLKDGSCLRGQSLPSLKQELQRSFDLVRTVVNALVESTDEVTAGTRGKIRELEAQWQEIEPGLGRLGAEPSLEELARFGQLAECMKGNISRSVREDRDILREAVEKARCLAVEILAQPVLVDIKCLLQNIHAEYSSRKRDFGYLDYEDLQEQSKRLLEVPSVLTWAQSQFRYIMVDEYQDTNGLQMDLIMQLVGDEPGDRLFVVGDPKQSIYRFRGAEVEVFARTERIITATSKGRRVMLDTNFRSQKGLVDFTNGFFQRLMPGGEADYDIRYEAVTANRDTELDCPVEWLCVPKGKGDAAQEVREREAAAVADSIARLAASTRFSYGDISILLRALTNVDIYLQALEQRNIPYTIASGTSFYTRQEIQDVLNYLHVLDNKCNELALLGVLRSPFCGINDETLLKMKEFGPLWNALIRCEEVPGVAAEEKERLKAFRGDLIRLRELRGRLSLADLLEEILYATGYYDLCALFPDGKKRKANLEKLLAVAQRFQQVSIWTLADFVAYLREAGLSEQEPEALLSSEAEDAVAIMSIHKSKGLEFPVVILPDLARQAQSDSSRIGFDRDLGLAVKLKDPTGQYLTTYGWETISAVEKARALAEEKRLLYVAATRARDKLIFVGPDEEVNQKGLDDCNRWSQWIAALIDPDGTARNERDAIASVGDAKVRVKVADAADSLHVPMGDRQSTEPSDGGGPQDVEPNLLAPVSRVGQVHSVTSLMVLQRCPRRYFYRYRCAMPELSPDLLAESARLQHRQTAAAEEESSPEDIAAGGTLSPLQTGNVVHRICERLFDPDEAEELIDWALQVEGVTGTDLPAARREVRKFIEAYMNSGFFAALKNIDSSQSEVPFTLTWEEHQIVGTIDRLCRVGNVYEIVDFKTNELTEAEIPEAMGEYEIQMQLYALAISRLTGKPVRRAMLYFLHPNVVREITPCPARTEEWLQQALQTTTGSDVKDFPQNPAACSKCWYRPICWEQGVPVAEETDE